MGSYRFVFFWRRRIRECAAGRPYPIFTRDYSGLLGIARDCSGLLGIAPSQTRPSSLILRRAVVWQGSTLKRTSGRQDPMFIGVLAVRSAVRCPSGRRQLAWARGPAFAGLRRGKQERLAGPPTPPVQGVTVSHDSAAIDLF